MSRRKKSVKRTILADSRYDSQTVSKFINVLMYQGKKSTAERIFYAAMDLVESRTSQPGVNVFKQTRADVEFLRGPLRLSVLFVQAKIGNGLLSNVELALLLVVIEEPRHRVQVFRIGIQGRPRLIKKLPQVLSLSKQIEIALDQFGRPQRLEAVCVHCQTLFD